MRRVGTEVCDMPTYDGFTNLEYFLTEFEEKVTEPQCLLGLCIEDYTYNMVGCAQGN